MVNGKQRGCKKILVLYTNFGKNRKPEKTNWVMHQYHLGQHEEEKEGELVVSKIFYQTQPRQCNWSNTTSSAAGEANSDVNSRRDSGSGSCSSSKDINIPRDELSAAVCAAMSTYSTMDIQQYKPEHFTFLPFRKTFDHEVLHSFFKLYTHISLYSLDTKSSYSSVIHLYNYIPSEMP